LGQSSASAANAFPETKFAILNNASTNTNYAIPSSCHGWYYVPHAVTISLDTTLIWNDLVVPGGGRLHNIPSSQNTTTTTNTSTDSSSSSSSQQQTHTTAHTNTAVTIKPLLRKLRPRLGQLLEACPLDGTKASAVTCVKFSPSTHFCLIGYGVREPLVEDHNGNQYHPVTALYRVQGGMTHV
jgi:hypothetical protein